MGTRNLTMVIYEGAVRVAQYGQWDGYLTGQGHTILNFLKTANLEEFKIKLSYCRFSDTTNKKELAYLQSLFNNPPVWAKVPPKNECYLSRDIAAGILQYILDYDEIKYLVLIDETDFAYDGILCEYAYVIDLDAERLEIYTGFHTLPPPDDQRFCSADAAPPEGWEPKYEGDPYYYPVQMAKSYAFSELATIDELTIGDRDDEEHRT